MSLHHVLVFPFSLAVDLCTDIHAYKHSSIADPMASCMAERRPVWRASDQERSTLIQTDQIKPR